MTAPDTAPTPVLSTGDPDQPMRAHVVCVVCHPEPVPLGAAAVCGQKVLGVVPPAVPLACADCLQIAATGAFPCGHG